MAHTGRLLGREAWLAAERGVRVRMLLDDMNAEGMAPSACTTRSATLAA